MTKKDYSVEKAVLADREEILGIMEHWNMHHVPSAEMEELDIESFFIVRMDGKIVGAAGYKVISQSQGKTTLQGVLPDYVGHGIGKAVQNARLKAMYKVGVKSVITNTDRPETISWLKRSYGFKQIGTLKKVCDFGHPDIDTWTTLELDLVAYMKVADLKAAEREYVARNEPHPLAPYPPFLINVCLTGMLPNKEMNPSTPVFPDEIIEAAIGVADQGAQIVHLHARGKDGKPTWKGEVYQEMIEGIRKERPELICCISTSGRNWPEFEYRSEALQLTGAAKPDMASLTLSSLNFPSTASVNEPKMIQRLAAEMLDKGIKPELEVFDLGMIGYAKYLERKGLLKGRKYFNLLLGSLGSIPATINNLSSLVADLPEDSVWAGAGIGCFQLPMNAAAMIAGGGVRVGLEDSIHYDLKQGQLTSNADLVGRIVRLAEELQRPLATTRQARAMVGL